MERTTTRRLKWYFRWIQRPPPPTFTLIYYLFTQIYTKYTNLFYSYSENSNRCTRRESRTAFSRWLPHAEIRDARTKSPKLSTATYEFAEVGHNNRSEPIRSLFGVFRAEIAHFCRKIVTKMHSTNQKFGF